MDLHLAAEGSDVKSLDRVLGQFEDFCIVTQSVRGGVAVDVRVIDRHGTVLTIPEAASEGHSGAEMTAAESA